MMFELQLLWAALIGYLLAGSLAIFAVVLDRRPERTLLALLVVGLAMHGLSIGLRWDRLGHGPFITMFEILSSNVWSLIAAFALAYWRIPAIRQTAAFVMPVMFVMMGWLLLTSPASGHYPPTYRTIWLFIHIGLGKVFLGATLVAVGISAVILTRSFEWGIERLARMPDDEKLDELAFRFMILGLIFETLMLVAGAIWAQDAWGRYWAWDPLETWAFLTWLALALAIHLRFAFGVPPRVNASLYIGVFIVAFLTFFGMPFVSMSPHKGAI